MEENEIVKSEFNGETILYLENKNISDQELFENSILQISNEQLIF